MRFGLFPIFLLGFLAAQAQAQTLVPKTIIKKPAAASRAKVTPAEAMPSTSGTPAINSQKMIQRKTGRTGLRPHGFYYVNAGIFSFADQVFAKVAGQKAQARSVFTGYSVGGEYTRYYARYIYSWNISLLTGSVDIQRVLGVTYPRKSFLGVQSGPELGYRINSDTDISYGLNLLYRNIEKVGGSMALSNQLNLRFRFTPRLTFFQSLGNYGKPTAYSYSLGLRWLL